MSLCRDFRVAILSALLSIHVGTGFGQESRALISGTVVDPSGASVGSASIRIRNIGTNFASDVHSESGGSYIIPELPPGVYELTVEAKGFKKYVRSGIELNVGDKARVDVRMEIGTTTETVAVSAALTGIETNAD